MSAVPAIAVPAADLVALPTPMVDVWPGRSVPADSFAGRLYRARIRAGWSINTIAGQTGLCPRVVGDLLDGTRLPTDDEAARIGRKLRLVG